MITRLWASSTSMPAAVWIPTEGATRGDYVELTNGKRDRDPPRTEKSPFPFLQKWGRGGEAWYYVIMQERDGERRRGNPERAFVAAWLLDGIRAAQRGDAKAAAWLDEFWPRLSGLIGLQIGDWRCAAQVPKMAVNRAARDPLTWKERQARKREQYKAST